MSIRSAGIAGLLILTVAGVSGCGNSGDAGSGSVTGPAPGAGTSAGVPPTAQCASPLAPQAVDYALTDDIPTDTDATANPSPTSTIAYTVLLPKRCAGDRFPLVLQSHGYGGNRLKTLAADGTLHPELPHFPSIDALVQALPYHGYVVISFDERGHGDSTNANARIIDPAAEVQDARRILDWAYDHGDQSFALHDDATGIAKDLRVGTIGYSYGGGFEMPLAALDARIDTIVPNGTWNDLLYSLLPGDGVKLSFDGLLCLLATTASTSAMPNTGVKNTPLVATLCNQVGVQGPTASTLRTRADLVAAMGRPTAMPRSATEAEINDFFYRHGTRYFETQQAAGKPWGFGETSARLRPLPALFLQGNRDTLFNLTEAYRNAAYFEAAGGDVRVLSTEGGHMNPLANQLEGPANCGKLSGVDTILAWFDARLKGMVSAGFDSIPPVCLSIADTPVSSTTATAYSDYNIAPAGLFLDAIPVGSLSGTGGVPAQRATLTAAVAAGATAPTFVPVATIAGGDKVLAGIPRVGKISVTAGTGAVQPAVAYVGVGIVRGGKTLLVDDEVTPFVAGDHTSNRGVNNTVIELPGVGEKLQDGDQVGLLFYASQVQYSAVISASNAPGATNIANTALGASIPPVTSAIDLSALNPPNPYNVTATQVELPILVPGQYPGSRLSQ